MDYEKDIQIDCDALDVEWLDQPGLMMKYARYAAEMRMEADNEKEALDLIKAGLDREIRTDPEKFGINKITESVILNTIIIQPRHVKANDIYIQARYESEVARGAVAAIEQRKTSLENLVKLHGQKYFAGPEVPRDLSWEWEQKEKQRRVDAVVGEKLRRSRK